MKDIYGFEGKVSKKVLNYYNIYSNLKNISNISGSYYNFNNFEIVTLGYICLPLEYYINELCIGLGFNTQWRMERSVWKLG